MQDSASKVRPIAPDLAEIGRTQPKTARDGGGRRAQDADAAALGRTRDLDVHGVPAAVQDPRRSVRRVAELRPHSRGRTDGDHLPDVIGGDYGLPM
ncbi:hypothetical protein PD653_4485 [Nocardioides sp. PD653]|nr:hypothetical protein PD653B2_4666 [Nocardioides sp. PD653-B2]GAW57043.1 hypothetical protein PD653_4485 [Nocardioides sp. PD653]